ncbi:transposase [Hansschlegelia plantiphila]|uniref:Transposase n=1 Tax=Hansschlegelia plantiphila TaxID=374655 RepID=A0A9W6MW31_9HYPH|nr:transposase [Hansschlegelia plantiphila]GLK68561.1 hypothetical protein GCM10008179_21990 [Hansschlegelia plantiphila]
MAASRLTDEEIAGLLHEVSQGASMEAVCAGAHVSVRTFYRWRRKFDGLTPAGVRQLKALRRENAELKKRLAEQSPRRADVAVLAPEARRPAGGDVRLREGRGLSVGRFATVRLIGSCRPTRP